MSTHEKILIGVAGPDMDVLQREFGAALLEDDHFTITLLAKGMENLTRGLGEGEPQILIVYADIASSPDELARVLGNLRRSLAVVLLPVNWATTQGLFERLGPVKKVYLLPVIPRDILREAESLVRTAQAIGSSTSPLQALGGGAVSQTAAVGTRILSFVSAEGGTGRTTLAENLAYELGVRRSINTLLGSFDWPATVPLHFKMNVAPSAAEFFARPGRSGFEDSLQKYKGDEVLQVLLAPQDMLAYSQAERRSESALQAGAKPQDVATSIHSLLLAAYSRMCAAVILDLPPAMPNSVWTWHSLAVSNTVLIVARPTLDGLKTVGTMTQVLTQMLATEHQIQRNSIFVVLNQRTSRSAFTPGAFSKEVSAAFGWCPPVLATFDFQEEIRAAQDNQRPAVETCEGFSKGIIALANNFWPSSSGEPVRVKGRKFGFLEILPDRKK
jgi:cellulose biosynthesis protein BcsQ